jgi:hypothetical protein
MVKRRPGSGFKRALTNLKASELTACSTKRSPSKVALVVVNLNKARRESKAGLPVNRRCTVSPNAHMSIAVAKGCDNSPGSTRSSGAI